MLKHIWIYLSVLSFVSHGFAMQHHFKDKRDHGLRMKMGKTPSPRPSAVCRNASQPRVDDVIMAEKKPCVATSSIFERVSTFLSKALISYLFLSATVLAQSPCQSIQVIQKTGELAVQDCQSCRLAPVSIHPVELSYVLNHFDDILAHFDEEPAKVMNPTDVWFEAVSNPSSLPMSPLKRCFILKAAQAFPMRGIAVEPIAVDASTVRSGVGAYIETMTKTKWNERFTGTDLFRSAMSDDYYDYHHISHFAVISPDPQEYGAQRGAVLHDMFHRTQCRDDYLERQMYNGDQTNQFGDQTSRFVPKVINEAKYPRGIEQEADAEALLYLAADCHVCAQEFADRRPRAVSAYGYLTKYEAQQLLTDYYHTHNSSRTHTCDFHKGINPLSGKPLSEDPLDINS